MLRSSKDPGEIDLLLRVERLDQPLRGKRGSTAVRVVHNNDVFDPEQVLGHGNRPQWLVSAVERRSTKPEDRITQLFSALHERFAAEGYYGCAFIGAGIEFPDPAHAIHRAARAH